MEHSPEVRSPGFEPASAHLDAELESRRGTAAAKTVRALANAALGMLTGEVESAMSTTDLVVTRRSTGGEILRVAAGSIIDGDQLLQRVQRDLEEKTVAEFLGEWRLPDESRG